VADDFSERFGNLLTACYDCVDRIVLNAHFSLGAMTGRFARRSGAWGESAGVPVIFCKAGQRKHLIAAEYLAAHEVGTGVFLVLVAKAPASVWEVRRTGTGAIAGLATSTSSRAGRTRRGPLAPRVRTFMISATLATRSRQPAVRASGT
jgi:hypothetical protein